MQVTDAELDVMRVLWANPGVSAADVHTALEGQKDWSRQTVKTLLTRLCGAAKSFVDKVFSGRAAPLVAHLADSRGLTEDDIAELESLIERLKS